MLSVRRLMTLAWLPAAAVLMVQVTLPGAAFGQESWVGIGAIGGTAMFMDTTGIVRTGSTRKAWIRSVDSDPRAILAGRDTLSFDTVVGLNEFDCTRETRTVLAVQYLLRGELVLDIPVTHDKPAAVRPRSFFAAVLRDLCRDAG